MKPVWWMVGGSVASWAALAAVPGMRGQREVLFGMLAPLVAAVSTWVLVARTYRFRPERLTALMIKGFAAKMVFFGAYVTVMLTVMSLSPMPFVISFTVYFIALHLIEAMFMQRLFAGTLNAD